MIYNLFLQHFRTYFTVCKTGYQFIAGSQSAGLLDDLAILQRQAVAPLQYIVGRSHLDELFGQLDKTGSALPNSSPHGLPNAPASLPTSMPIGLKRHGHPLAIACLSVGAANGSVRSGLLPKQADDSPAIALNSFVSTRYRSPTNKRPVATSPPPRQLCPSARSGTRLRPSASSSVYGPPYPGSCHRVHARYRL